MDNMGLENKANLMKKRSLQIVNEHFRVPSGCEEGFAIPNRFKLYGG